MIILITFISKGIGTRKLEVILKSKHIYGLHMYLNMYESLE